VGIRVPNVGTRQMMDRATEMVTGEESQMELVVIDDAQFLLCSQNPTHRRQSLGFVLGLVKKKTCNVVLGGTANVYDAMKNFPHAFNQGMFPHHTIHPYRWEVKRERDQFLLMLHMIDLRLPFRQLSRLATNRYVAANLYRGSVGAIGSVMQYVKAGAFDAMNKGLDNITPENWELAAQGRADPSDPHRLFAGEIDEEDPLKSR
jgi:hypothetical protein